MAAMKTLEDFYTKKMPWEEGVEWREMRLGEIFEIVRGGSPRPIKQYLTTSKEGINWIKISDAEEGSKYIIKTKDKIIKEGIKKSRVVHPGDLLLTNSMTVGKAYISKIRGCIHDGWLLLHPKLDTLYPDYFYYLLNSHILKIKFSKKARGGVVRNLNTSLVKSTEIPLPFRNGKPDLETQKKIVEYIEENFSRIDKILEKKKKELEQIDELWESVLDEAFKPKEGEEWREIRLGDKMIAEIIMGQSPPSSSYNKRGEGVPFLQGNKEFGRFHPKHVMFTTNPKKNAQIGDILLSVRAPVGDVNIADREYCIGRGLAAIRFNGEPKYLFYFLIDTKEDLEEIGRRGTTFKAITKNHLKNLKIPLPFRNGKPDLEKQKEIANYLDGVYEKIKTLKEKIQNQITQLEEMKESILDEVFNRDKETNN
ncbi:MAG: restriction endonuclease subunit S [Deltaproteobacteria bacterium]|nr:restriction endonuclease subunit S [Deltaproteobacteria bacterium]